MSFQEENDQAAMAVPQRTSNNEVEDLRRQLAESQKETAITGFLAQIGQQFPGIPQADLRSLVVDRLRYADGRLEGTESAVDFLRSRPYLARASPVSTSSSSAASPDAHLRWQQVEGRKAYLWDQYFGPAPGASKRANDLAKTDLAAYRHLRSEAQALGLISGPAAKKR